MNKPPAPLSGSGAEALSGFEEQLELDVVRVAEHYDGGAGDGVRGCGRGIGDAGGGEAALPAAELGPGGYRERQVVQPDGGFVERELPAAAVLGQPEADAEALVPHEHLPA